MEDNICPNCKNTGIYFFSDRVPEICDCKNLNKTNEMKKSGIELITEERQRQIEVEGFNVEKDIESYSGGEIVGAACCYATNALNKQNTEIEGDFARFQILRFEENDWIDGWPWDKQYDKREKHDQLRSLVIAGALIAAEIDRIQAMS